MTQTDVGGRRSTGIGVDRAEAAGIVRVPGPAGDAARYLLLVRYIHITFFCVEVRIHGTPSDVLGVVQQRVGAFRQQRHDIFRNCAEPRLRYLVVGKRNASALNACCRVIDNGARQQGREIAAFESFGRHCNQREPGAGISVLFER